MLLWFYIWSRAEKGPRVGEELVPGWGNRPSAALGHCGGVERRPHLPQEGT